MTRMRGIALGILLSAGGCSFDSAEPGPVVVNSCSMAMECVSGAESVMVSFVRSSPFSSVVMRSGL